ncbi:aspartate aminotransferase [Thioalkalivibrio denitrificans]|uniref:Aminotransferase n=1 Tax=Thioalkalivibrio denitrificans TaxID=108003 RepID=A0A1V3NCG8_9GAMM|nr:aminotransferase class I/II-fold pyridoxal phosphate-dependent enzyme [Thioalkalivibrio denitrificans]OOG22797.1 aspartate aminotransferase [Thioalkalivibrio denitrificans]
MTPDDSYSPRVQLNLNARGLPQSATLAINERCAAMRREGRSVFRMGLGQSPFPVPEPVVEALRANSHQKDYLPVKGLPELRQAIVDYLHRHEGLSFSADHVLVGPGTKELMFIVQLVYYGDLVIPTPSWVSYAPQAHIIGRHLRWLPTHPETGLGVTPEALDALCRVDPDRPRLLILNSPGNPTGSAYAVEQLQAIAEVARRYRVLVLSDEIYSGLHFEGKHVSIARFYPEGTIISNGLSKWCGAGGWRLGALAFPRSLTWLLEPMASVASETFTSTSAPIQYAAVRAFEGGPEIEHYLTQCRRILRAIAHYTWESVRAVGAVATEPKGGFYLFPNFDPLRERLASRGITTSEQLCLHLLEDTGVACLPGEAFGRPLDELSVRLALVDFDGQKALEAAESLPEGTDPDNEFLRRHCGDVVEAVDRLCAWVS